MEATLSIKGQKKLSLPKTATYPNATSQTELHQTVGVILNYVSAVKRNFFIVIQTVCIDVSHGYQSKQN